MRLDSRHHPLSAGKHFPFPHSWSILPELKTICSSDVLKGVHNAFASPQHHGHGRRSPACRHDRSTARRLCDLPAQVHDISTRQENEAGRIRQSPSTSRSEEHTSELQSLMRISYAVFCLKKKKTRLNKLQAPQP